MRLDRGLGARLAVGVTACAALVYSYSAGCAGGASPYSLLGQPFFLTDGTVTPGGGTVDPGGSTFGAGTRANIDPCLEREDRKFVRISMRNLAEDDFIHYFVAFVAFVNGDIYPDGAVCADDIATYTLFGYDQIDDGDFFEFGSYCIAGPALIYFHRTGQFQTGPGALASAIGPAQGASATFDPFFNSAGVLVPIPNSILWHNPGTGAGATLQVGPRRPSPCTSVIVGGFPDECRADAFYYVDETDRINGSNALGTGAGVRVPNEIQGAGCEAGGFDNDLFTSVSQLLAPSTTTASDARGNEFLRGGRIEYAFLRVDTDPPFPQLVWRVSDGSGAIAHDFDSRANIP